MYFYFQHGESTSTASQLTSPASQKSKDLNKVSLLLQDLGLSDENHVRNKEETARWCKIEAHYSVLLGLNNKIS